VQAAVRAAGLDVEVRPRGELGHDMVGRLSQFELELIAQGPPRSRWLLVETPFDADQRRLDHRPARAGVAGGRTAARRGPRSGDQLGRPRPPRPPLLDEAGTLLVELGFPASFCRDLIFTGPPRLLLSGIGAGALV
jgi:hypothetical protein